MKKILEKIGHLFSRPKMAAKAAIDLEVLANLELAQSFNHPVYLHFNKKKYRINELYSQYNQYHRATSRDKRYRVQSNSDYLIK